MNKIKRGVSLLLCSLLLGSILTAGSVTDVQASKQQTTTVTKQSIKNTKTAKEVSDDQTSDKAGQNKENETEETAQTAQTDTVESSETFSVLPVYAGTETAISADRETGIRQIMDVGFTDRNFASAVYDSLFEAGWLGTGDQTVKEVLGSFTGTIEADGYERKLTYIVTANKILFNPSTHVIAVSEQFDTLEKATVYYDSLVDIPGVEQYADKKITQKKVASNTQKPESELIKNIEGIEWLRKAESIDLKNNAISDLNPLSIERIKAIASENGETDIQEGKAWFGSKAKNVSIDVSINPIQRIPEEAAGRLLFDTLTKVASEMKLPSFVYIKPDENIPDIEISEKIQLPEMKRGDKLFEISKNKDDTYIALQKDNEGAVIDYNHLTNTELPIEGISRSGKLVIGVAVAENSEFKFWGTAENFVDDLITPSSTSIKYKFSQMLNVYTKVKPGPSSAFTEIDFTKTVADTDRPVKGAKFQLYKAYVNSEGNSEQGDLYDSNYYTTDENGKISFEATLPSGSYCFVEAEAPKGFKLDSTPLFFQVGGGKVVITGGEPTVTPTGGQATSAGADSTYIDRYSPEVTMEVIPDKGLELYKIIVCYFDRETQTNVYQEFKNETEKNEAATNAAAFINAGKGGANKVGIIDGTVTVYPVFTQEKVTLQAENERATTDFSFQKINVETGDPMTGVTFELTCDHKHDEECGGLNSPELCTHAHNDVKGNTDKKGCTWTNEQESAEDGSVTFSDLTSGTYILEELETLEGFILPKGTWTVTVNADPDKGEERITVKKTNKDDSMTPEFKLEGDSFVVGNDPTVPFSFQKIDEKTGDALADAEFTIYQEKDETSGEWEQVGEPVGSSKEGVVDFGRLKPGTYFLVETKAPKGYLKPTGYWEVVIQITKEGTEEVAFKAVGDVPAISGNYIDGFKISNRETSRLPKLGGNGTGIFVFSGVVIICCSLVLYFKFKRRGA